MVSGSVARRGGTTRQSGTTRRSRAGEIGAGHRRIARPLLEALGLTPFGACVKNRCRTILTSSKATVVGNLTSLFSAAVFPADVPPASPLRSSMPWSSFDGPLPEYGLSTAMVALPAVRD